jgi:AAA domain/Bifunctional DNA primase/polymerase, N-terminal
MSGPYGDAAQSYWRAGWPNPIPVKNKRHPPSGFTGYEGANVSWPDLQAWIDGPEANHNIALRLPGDIVGIDVDAYDDKMGETSITAAEAELGPLPASYRSTSRAPFMPSGIRFYRLSGLVDLRGAEKRFVARFGDHVDILRRDHRYAIVWPSVHPDTGAIYLWYDPTGERCDPPSPADLPELPDAWQTFLISPAGTAPTTAGVSTADPTDTGDPPPFWDLLPRTFTQEQAIEFVRPAFEQLRSAPNGTINNRLNEAAVTIGHFVPEFWTRAAAEAWLLDALTTTAYDGRTWQAETTIASGLAAKTWRAERVAGEVPDAAVTTEDGRVEYLNREVARLHLKAEARDIFTAERHAKAWVAPTDHGSLTGELEVPDEATQWRFDGLLGTGHNAVVVAGRKVGKTTLINNLILSYVDGEPFLNRFEVTASERAIAIFNYEVDERQYRRWIRAIDIINTDRVFVLHLRGRTLPLRDSQVRAWVVRWLRERHVGLWLLDPYSRAYVGSLDNGNDEAQVGTFLDTLDVIKHDAEVDELVLPVHTPKARVEAGDETAIGSQRLEGWPDSMWYLTRDFESGLRFLRAEGRDVEVPEEQLTYDLDTRRLALGGWDRASLRKQTDSKTIVEAIRGNPGCSQNDLMAALQWGSQRVKKAIQAAGGRVRTTPGKGGANRHYVDS